jgi:gliding motility-associated-like protein
MQTNVSCNGSCDGTATVNASGGTAGYTYSWAPSGGTAATAGSLCAGTYTCTITDANGCAITRTYTITQPSVLTATTTQTNVSCNGGCDGTATVTASGGTAGYTYFWAPSGGTGAVAASLCAGTYTCTITDVNSCSTSVIVTIIQSSPLTSVAAQTNVSCNGACDGTAAVTVSGGTPGYTYLWAPSGGSAAAAGSLCAGTYTCTITDANGCSQNEIFTITEPAVLSATVTQTNVSCNGICDGTASLTASGGTMAYSYIWSPSGGPAAAAAGLCAGTYTCTVTDANGCTVISTSVITEPPALTATIVKTNVSCNGICNGTATISAGGGSLPYSYAWAPSGGTGVTASGLCAGTYSCTVTDANGCAIVQAIVITEPLPLTASAAGTNVNCNASCDGTAAVIASGGTTGYTYAWAPSGGFTATAASLCAGTYTCTVADTNGCITTVPVTITEPAALSVSAIQANVSCNAACNGTATVTASGGTPGYGYSWLPSGGTAATATGLCAGSYTCTITDSNGCSITQAIIITEPPVLIASSVHSNALCNGSCNGTAVIMPAGGTGGYNYLWTPGSASASSVSGLCAGIYICTITDASACSINDTIIITEPAALTASITSSIVTCFGGNDGTAGSTVSGGTTPYTYLWSDGSTLSTTGSLPAGPVQLTVTDSNACSITVVSAITQNSPLVISVNSDSVCTGQAAILTASGALNYAWAADPTLSSSTGASVTATPLTNTVYMVVGTDTNGCTDTAYSTVTLFSAPVVAVSGNDTICPGTATLLTATGAATYAWSPVTGLSAPSAAITSASPSSTIIYTVTGTSAQGCTDTAVYMVTVLPAPIVNVTGDSVCNGSTATITASGASTYSWTPSSGLSSTSGATVNATVSTATSYTVTGTDANGCLSSATATVMVLPLPVLSVNSPSVCAGSSVNLDVTGAQTYAWSPATGLASTVGSTVAASPAASTTYTVTGTDVYGCVSSTSSVVTLLQLPQVAVTGDSVACPGDALTLTATATGTVLWSTGAGSSSVTITPSASGYYSATASNSCGSQTGGIFVIVNAPPSASAGPDVTVGLGNSIQLNGSGGTSYSWFPSQWLSCSGCADPVSTPETTTSYIVTVSDVNGCSAFDTVVVTVNGEAQVFVPDIFSPDGDGMNDNFIVRGSGIKSLNLKIYDRWGQVVFSGFDENSVSWDGTYKGSVLNNGVFVYTLDITYYDHPPQQKKGNLTLKK